MLDDGKTIHHHFLGPPDPQLQIALKDAAFCNREIMADYGFIIVIICSG